MVEKKIDERTLQIARDRIKENPNAVDCWNILVHSCRNKKADVCRDFFESLVSQFPTCGRYWKAYIECELNDRNFERVEKLFQRCLVNVLNIDLWMCYLFYLEKNKSSLPNYRQTIIKAYEFALEKVGLDPYCAPVYVAFVQFMNLTLSVKEEFHQIRQVHIRALSSPLVGLEQVWDLFCKLEMNICPSAQHASARIDEQARCYERMKRLGHEIDRLLGAVDIGAPCVVPSWSNDELKSVQLWKNYIEWEKRNPLNLPDANLVAKRVNYAYEQCLLTFGYYTDIWHQAAHYMVAMADANTDPETKYMYIERARQF